MRDSEVSNVQNLTPYISSHVIEGSSLVNLMSQYSQARFSFVRQRQLIADRAITDSSFGEEWRTSVSTYSRNYVTGGQLAKTIGLIDDVGSCINLLILSHTLENVRRENC